MPRAGRGELACLSEAGRPNSLEGFREPFFQRPSPPSGLHVRPPALRHRGKGRQSVERGPRPVQLDPPQWWKAAGRKAPGMAAVGRRVADAPSREVPPEAPRRGRGQLERGRLCAALRRVLRGAREEVRVRLRDECLRGHRRPHKAGRPRPARPTAASGGRNRIGVPAHFPTGRLETPPCLARSVPRRRDRSGAGTHLPDQARRIGRTLRVGREVPSDVARHPFGPRTIPGREGRGRESEGEETMTRTTGDRERSRLGESATGGLNTLRLESRLESEEEISMSIPIGTRAGRLTFEGDFATLTFERTLDRKSTRLNSSHRTISYAVFCLKKKKNDRRVGIPAPPGHARRPAPAGCPPAGRCFAWSP